MNELLLTCIGLTLLASVGTECKADDLRKVSTIKCMNRAEDYSFMWWAHGLRDQKRIRCYQTGRYGMAVDTENIRVLHLGTIAKAASAEEVLTQNNDTVFSLPDADLSLSVTIEGKVYRCVRGVVKYPEQNGARLVESGCFFQRGDVWGLEFQDADGNHLLADGRFEVAVWPDHLGFLLQVWSIAEFETSEHLQESKEDGWKNVVLDISLKSMGEVFSCKKEYKQLKPYEKARVFIAIQPKAGGKGWEESEMSPTVTVFATTSEQPCPVEYNPALGWFKVDINNARPDDLNRDSIERVKICLRNPETKEKVCRLMFNKDRVGLRGAYGVSPVTGISPMLCDTEGIPLGIPVQISKNWHSADAFIPYQGLWFHGLTMLNLPPKSEVELELRIAYAQWGGIAAASHAQLCLIGWGNNQLWNQAAIGAWGESICFEPDQGQVGGAVLDVRPLMVYSKSKEKPTKWSWTNNVGGADFLIYYDTTANKKQWHSRMRTLYQRYCPNLTEVTYAGRTQDSKIDRQYTVGLYRCDDITRGVYQFRYDVRHPVDFSRLVLLQCGGDHYSYTGERKFAIGNEAGLIKEWDTQWGGNIYRTQPMELSGSILWLSMHEAVSRDESEAGTWANRGIVIRSWKARLGGKPANPWVAERGARVRGRDTSLFDILPPHGVNQLHPGDFVEAEVVHVIVPQFARDYYGTNENLRAALQKNENTWRMIYREAVGNDLHIKVRRGRSLHNYPILIEVDENQTADFSVTGGIGYIPVTFNGLDGYYGWELIRLDEKGDEHTVDQSIHGNDFWQTNYDPITRKWSRTYNVLLDTPGDRMRTVQFIFRRRSE